MSRPLAEVVRYYVSLPHTDELAKGIIKTRDEHWTGITKELGSLISRSLESPKVENPQHAYDTWLDHINRVIPYDSETVGLFIVKEFVLNRVAGSAKNERLEQFHDVVRAQTSTDNQQEQSGV